MPLTLQVDERSYPETLKIPSIFKKIDGKEFEVLILKGTGSFDVLSEQHRGFSKEESIAQILSAVASWSNLGVVRPSLLTGEQGCPAGLKS